MKVLIKCERCGKYIYNKDAVNITVNNKESYNVCNNCSKYFHNWLKGRKDLGIIEIKN